MTAAHHDTIGVETIPRLHVVTDGRARAADPLPTIRDAPHLPRLRLRALPQPQPADWSPTSPGGATVPGAPGQLAMVLHGLPRAQPEPDDSSPVPTPRDELPCPEPLARSLVQAAMDVVRGHRPASQVLRWTTPEVYSQLRQRARLEQAGSRTGGRRPVVRSLRVSPAGPRGTEVSAVVLDGPRARAVAARLDGEDGRWRLTALVIG